MSTVGFSQATILVNLIHLNIFYNEIYYYFVVTGRMEDVAEKANIHKTD